jgi:hypothetical protein
VLGDDFWQKDGGQKNGSPLLPVGNYEQSEFALVAAFTGV